jgi:hypothetical protein
MSLQYFLAKQEAAPFIIDKSVQEPVIIPEVIPAKPDLTIEGIKNPEPVPQFIDTDTAKKLLLNDYPVPDDIVVLPVSKVLFPEVFAKTAEVKAALPDIPVDEIIEVVKAEIATQKNEKEITAIIETLPKKKEKFIDKLTNYIYRIFYK